MVERGGWWDEECLRRGFAGFKTVSLVEIGIRSNRLLEIQCRLVYRRSARGYQVSFTSAGRSLENRLLRDVRAPRIPRMRAR